MIDHSKHVCRFFLLFVTPSRTILQKLRVIDWGLAEYYRPGTEYNVRVASRHYKPPELLVNMRMYDYSLDMWSLGCVLASMLFQVTPFFRGKDDEDQLVKITEVLGHRALTEYLAMYDLQLSPAHPAIVQPFEGTPWGSFITPANQHLEQ
jgi:casein kinase II subunit alpha